MKFLKSLCFALLASSLMLGQSTSNSSSSSDNIADELKKLRDAVSEQQKQIAQQQEQIQKLEQQLAGKQDVAAKTSEVSPRIVDASLRTPTNSATTTAKPVSDGAPPQEKPKESPLSFRIGGAEFTPGGFVDFENVFRSTNTGFVTATNFWAIPFSNTVSGHLTEYRSTAQYSRFNLKTTAKYGKNDITGYLEFDFNGNDATNVFVTSNPHTDRLRLYWLDLKRDKWEFLGGQTWGLQSPNRLGLSPSPADIFTTYGEDAQTHVGVNYTRAAEFRAVYHFNDNFQWGASIQNPQQFVGQGAEVVVPSAFNAQINGTLPQVDAANNIGTPNLAPDVISKIAYDNKFGGRAFHIEGGGLLTTAKITVLPTGGAGFVQHSTVGGGFMGGLNVELWKGSENRNINFVGYGMWGYGIGRYLIAMAPQFVVAPVTTAGGTTCSSHTNPGPPAVVVVTGNCDVATSGVHSGDLVTGFEFRPHAKSQFGVYYGGMYAQRNTFRDLTGGSTQPVIGFGGFGEANSSVQNRAIQEGSIDWTQTFWRNPQYGAVLLVTQASYVTRAPWFVALGAPKNAHLTMGYVSLRYVLP